MTRHNGPVQNSTVGTPWRKHASAGLSVLGLVLISYVLGASAMFYQLPTSRCLANAFVGAHLWRAWQDADRDRSNLVVAASSSSDVDRPEKTFDGFTFYTLLKKSQEEPGSQADLIDMRRQLVHRWSIRLNDIWPESPHLDTRFGYPASNFFGSFLYPNGDLLITFHGDCQPCGCGLAKIDAQSKLLWAYPAAIHHDVDVAEDGTIYALRHDYLQKSPAGLQMWLPALVDYVVTLTADGQPLREPISVLEAFRKSPYAALLAPLEKALHEHTPPPGSTAPQITYPTCFDALHTNCVRVLRRDMAVKFPKFKAGHVLISVRNLNVIALLDPDEGRIEWATRGPWLAQHDAQFLDNGHLLIFDNLGASTGSRVIEFDPETQSFPWFYSATDAGGLYTSERGMNQRLPNGNTFIVSTEEGRMIEVTPDKEIVWSYSVDGYFTSGRRYSPGELSFLHEGQHARP
jgi:hypothetical protein